MTGWLLALMIDPAGACGPDFPHRLAPTRDLALLAAPEGTFHWEVRSVAPEPARALPRGEGTRAAQMRSGLTDVEVATLEAMAAAPGPDRPDSLGARLPEELRLYALGAHAFHHGAPDQARTWFERVLALPPLDRPRRGVWARYMLGRLASAPDEATRAFTTVREEVAAGAADPMGLALASLGEEARWWLDVDRPRAWRLYAEQAAMGSVSGALSLYQEVRALSRAVPDDALDRYLADPVMRGVLVTYLWTRPEEVQSAAPDALTAPRLLAAVQRTGVEIERADQLAAIAYRTGDYALAESFLGAATGPLAAWVRAKIALRAGDQAAAASAYAEAARGFPADELWSVGLVTDYGRAYVTMEVQKVVYAERGLLQLTQGDYRDALRTLLAAVVVGDGLGVGWDQGWEDAAYVAERVLTVDELLGFVQSEGDAVHPSLRPALRALLGRRLMRAGRPSEAVRFFDDPEVATNAAAYADAMARTERGGAVDRAEAWLEAAELLRPGIDLFGTEGAPDYAAFDGVYERWGESSLVPDDPAWQGADEAERVAASAPEPDRRFHYREVASMHAEAAADLLPTDSQAFAVALCRAARYVSARGPAERVEELYLRYVREGPLYDGSGSFGSVCPDPDFEGLRSRLRAEWYRVWGPPGGAVLVGLLLVLAALGIRRRGRN